MARSRLREDQMLDADVLTEEEHLNYTHYFRDLEDTATISGANVGQYLRINTASGIEYADIDSDAFLKKDGSVQLTDDWDFGEKTISGTGDIYCNDLHTTASSVYVGEKRLSNKSGDLFWDDKPLVYNPSGSATSHSDIIHTFADLVDVPTLSGNGGRTLRVKNDGTMLEFDGYEELYPRSYTPASGTLNISFDGGYSSPSADNVDFIFTIYYYMYNGDRVFMNSTDKGFYLVLPSNPKMGDFVSFIDGGGYCASNNVTISGSGNKIMGSYSPYVVDENFESFDLIFYNDDSGWIKK